jgi:type II secretory pathway pseudopilin PulG
MSKMRAKAVRVLLSLLWIIIPLGALAAVVVPNVLNATHRARQKRSMADMRTVATAIEARATDTKKYDLAPRANGLPKGDPLRVETLRRVTHEELSRSLRPTYVRSLPRLDGWGTELDVRIDGESSFYIVRSAGSDRVFQKQPYRFGATQDFREDILFSQGNFLQYPEGICSQ